MSTSPKLRCAVYTRKSTEEGLEQEFNSLDAQREACLAFIASQAGLGWKLVHEHYDDGGVSGGTMDRPALQRLLSDIRDGSINVVVVYKIDRLTRLLMDFARIVEIFDANDVSFVSVTQAFNTTTSMGRLTLNVLLSFAQFEREVTAERIRDKIAASKKKGMWMGGTVPLGYEVRERKLLVNDAEARIVRHLFNRYLELRSVRVLVEETAASGLKGRATTQGKSPEMEAKPFGRGTLYHLLSNPIYIGKIRHRDQLYEGEHQPIIDDDLFTEVQALLAVQAPRRSASTNTPDIHLLTGIVFDETGDRLSPVHANKKGKRYRYYVSSRLTRTRKKDNDGWRIPASEIESLAEHQLTETLTETPLLADWIREQQRSALTIMDAVQAARDYVASPASMVPPERKAIMQRVFRRIEMRPNWIRFEIDKSGLVGWLTDFGKEPSRREVTTGKRLAEGGDTEIHIVERPISMKRRGVEARIVLSSGTLQRRSSDRGLIDLIARAQLYLDQLTDGSNATLADVASNCGTDPSEVSRILPLAYIAPRIVRTIIKGEQPLELTAQRLSRMSGLPIVWQDQLEALGF